MLVALYMAAFETASEPGTRQTSALCLPHQLDRIQYQQVSLGIDEFVRYLFPSKEQNFSVEYREQLPSWIAVL